MYIQQVIVSSTSKLNISNSLCISRRHSILINYLSSLLLFIVMIKSFFVVFAQVLRSPTFFHSSFVDCIKMMEIFTMELWALEWSGENAQLDKYISMHNRKSVPSISIFIFRFFNELTKESFINFSARVTAVTYIPNGWITTNSEVVYYTKARKSLRSEV